jgi:hypothetical protein
VAKGQKLAKVREELKKKKGRRPVLTEEVFQRILDGICQGKSNAKACEEAGTAPETLYLNLAKHQDMMQRYREVKNTSVEAMAEEALETNRKALKAATGAEVQAHKHLADGLRWTAARLAPQRWGERAQVEIIGRVDLTDPHELAKRLAFLERLSSPHAQVIDAQAIDMTDEYGPDAGTDTDLTD